MKAEEHEYTVDLAWEKGRVGKLSSEKLKAQFEVATPPEFPGGSLAELQKPFRIY